MKMNRRICTLWLLLLCVVFLVLCGGSGSSRPLKSSGNAEELRETQREPPQSADLFTPPSCCTYCIIVGLGSGLAGGLLCIGVVFIVWKCKKSTILLYILSAKKKDLVEKEAQLRKQSQKTQEELDAWGAVLTQSMEVKGGLGNQREEFRLQLEEIEKEREENKEKLNLVEKEIAESEKEKATDKTEGYLREKQNLLNAQRKLEKRKEELEKQQLNVEKLLQKAEGMMATITARKRKAENLMELIHLHLEELESQDDTAHLHRK